MSIDQQNSELIKLLKLFVKSSSGRKISLKEGEDWFMVANRNQRFPSTVLRRALGKKLLLQQNDRVLITQSGRHYLKKWLVGKSEIENPQKQVVSQTVLMDGESIKIQANLSESPLMRLYSRKLKGGCSYINDCQFRAGDRLRADFEKGNIQPRISANLEASVAGRNRSPGDSIAGALSDFALDRRKAFAAAIEHIGPELGGVAVDVCCFLKGLETVERERAWPPRSAKLMLRTALDMLSRHYGMVAENYTPARKQSHWGTEDFRPHLVVSGGLCGAVSD